jgi:large subunit ribosomal protein L25
MEKHTLTAEVRTERGKGPARQLRMQGKIPAVLYGPGGESLVLAVDPVQLTKALTGAFRRNQVLELDIAGGTKEYALVKDLDVHPVGRQVRHADFYRISLDKPVTTDVPLRTKGRAKGVGKGGELRVHFREVPVRATPDKIPAEIMINVENVDMLESVRVKDVALEAGVEIVLPADRALVFVTSEQKKVVEETEGAPGAPAGKAATPSKAPPAAKPAAKK